jgi:hypothetical protein
LGRRRAEALVSERQMHYCYRQLYAKMIGR